MFDVLTWLVRHEASVLEAYNERSELTRQVVSEDLTWRAVTEEELRVIFAQYRVTGETQAMNGWVYLPKLPRGIGRIPLLNCMYDRGREPMGLSLQLAVFWLDEECEVNADGWRFESPEQAGATGFSDHAYYHAHPCRELRTHRRQVKIEHEPAASSADIPTFPLDASDALSLLVALLVTFYGRREAADLIRSSAIPELERALVAMRTLHPRHDPAGRDSDH